MTEAEALVAHEHARSQHEREQEAGNRPRSWIERMPGLSILVDLEYSQARAGFDRREREVVRAEAVPREVVYADQKHGQTARNPDVDDREQDDDLAELELVCRGDIRKGVGAEAASDNEVRRRDVDCDDVAAHEKRVHCGGWGRDRRRMHRVQRREEHRAGRHSVCIHDNARQ